MNKAMILSRRRMFHAKKEGYEIAEYIYNDDASGYFLLPFTLEAARLDDNVANRNYYVGYSDTYLDIMLPSTSTMYGNRSLSNTFYYGEWGQINSFFSKVFGVGSYVSSYSAASFSLPTSLRLTIYWLGEGGSATVKGYVTDTEEYSTEINTTYAKSSSAEGLIRSTGVGTKFFGYKITERNRSSNIYENLVPIKFADGSGAFLDTVREEIIMPTEGTFTGVTASDLVQSLNAVGMSSGENSEENIQMLNQIGIQ